MKEKGTRDFTTEEKEIIRDIIQEGILMRKSNSDIMMKIENKAHIAIALSTLKHMKVGIRKEARKLLTGYMMDNNKFVDRYLQVMSQLDLLIKQAYQLYESAVEDSIRKECLNSIHNYILSWHKLFNFLPELCGMKPFEDAKAMLEEQKINFNGIINK